MKHGKEIYMGLESERYCAARHRDGSPFEPRAAGLALLDMAARLIPHVRDESGRGMFLPDGSRFYPDGGYSDFHVETASPEVDSPLELVRQVHASERMLVALAEKCEKEGRFSEVTVSSQTYCYHNRVGYGSHENISVAVPAAEAMMPFLVSRIVICGAGGLNPHSPGIRFLHSPRSAFVSCGRSGHTQGYGRGIWDTLNIDKARYSGVRPRFHLHCGDGNRSQTSLYLRFGITALVAAAFEAGARIPLERIGLTDDEAVNAFRNFAADATCQVRVEAWGGWYSAIEIQVQYLEMIESVLPRLPEWASEVCNLWRHVLAKLQSDPGTLARSLDSHIKRRLFDSMIRRSRFVAEDIEQLSAFVEWLEPKIQEDGDNEFRLTSMSLGSLSHRQLAAACRRANFGGMEEGECLMEFLLLREKLAVLDMTYMQLGPASLFSKLVAAGDIDPAVPGMARVEDTGDPLALCPPSSGRARSRGCLVAAFGERGSKAKGKGFTCSWHQFSGPGLRVNFSDVGKEAEFPQVLLPEATSKASLRF